MAYDDIKKESGREPVWIAELDLDSCSLTYGVGACTATGSSGSECYQCFSTCQVTTAFSRSSQTLRFSSTRLDGVQATGEAPTFPTVLSVSTAPTVLTPSKGLGIRSTCSVTLVDHPWTDEVTDPYVSGRSYDPLDQGTFWGRLLARNKFYEGREMRVKTGYLTTAGTYDASNFITRTYFIDTITGPDASGKVSIKGKDILKFADREKAQLPTQSQATLSADISSSTTSFDIVDPNDDVKNAYDAGQTYIRVDDEVMLMSSLSGASSPYTATVTRASMPSVYQGTMSAEEHNEDASVQHCHFFNQETPDDIAKFILVDTAGVSSAFANLTGWQGVVDSGLQNYTFSTLLTEPTGGNDLLNELAQHTVFWWWDERAQLIEMDSLLNKSQNAGPFTDDDNNIAGTVGVARNDRGRLSQVWVAHGLRNPVLEMDEIKNFESVKVSVDLDSEGENQYDQKKVMRIWSRWVPTTLSSVASEIANRTLNYYKTTKRIATVTLDPKDDSIWTGDLITLKTRQLQDETGASPETGFRILQVSESLKPGDVRHKYVMETLDQDFVRTGLITPTLNPENTAVAFPDYGSASDSLKSQYAFISEDDRGDGDPGFTPDEAPYTIA